MSFDGGFRDRIRYTFLVNPLLSKTSREETQRTRPICLCVSRIHYVIWAHLHGMHGRIGNSDPELTSRKFLGTYITLPGVLMGNWYIVGYPPLWYFMTLFQYIMCFLNLKGNIDGFLDVGYTYESFVKFTH